MSQKKCNCIETVQKNLKTKLEKSDINVTEVFLDSSIATNRDLELTERYMPIVWSYSYVNRNGNISKKKEHLVPSYCVFCGREMDYKTSGNQS